MADCSWSGVPHSHGLNITVDWISADGYTSIPPLKSICGWPLVNSAPPPFGINGL